jgi:hypothetical protein
MRSGSERSSARWQKASRERLNALVSNGFALGGLLVATVLYGLLAFLVAACTKEIHPYHACCTAGPNCVPWPSQSRLSREHVSSRIG